MKRPTCRFSSAMSAGSSGTITGDLQVRLTVRSGMCGREPTWPSRISCAARRPLASAPSISARLASCVCSPQAWNGPGGRPRRGRRRRARVGGAHPRVVVPGREHGRVRARARDRAAGGRASRATSRARRRREAARAPVPSPRTRSRPAARRRRRSPSSSSSARAPRGRRSARRRRASGTKSFAAWPYSTAAYAARSGSGRGGSKAIRSTTLAGTASTTRSASSSAPPAETTTRRPRSRRSARPGSRGARPARARAASASAIRWLPPATLGQTSSECAASPASAVASTRSAVAALDTSRRAWIASRAPGSSGERVEQRSRRRPGRARGRPAAIRSSASCERLRRRRRAATRLALAVPHPLVPEAEPEPLDERADRVVAREDELGAQLDDGAVRELPRPDAAADPVARLEHDHLDARGGERVGRGEAGEPGADDGDAHGPAPSSSARTRGARPPSGGATARRRSRATSTASASAARTPAASGSPPAG